MLAGNAQPSFPVGPPNKVAVVKIGRLSRDLSGSSSLPFVFRDNTAKAISHVDVSATIRNQGGKLLTTGTSQGTVPAQVAPGGTGLAFIYFEHGVAPASNLKYDFDFETQDADTSSYNTASIRATEANHSGDSIVGTGRNTTGKRLTGPYSVDTYCFVGDVPSYNSRTFADQDKDLSPNATLTFSDDLLSKPCPKFLVGIAGYYA